MRLSRRALVIVSVAVFFVAVGFVPSFQSGPAARVLGHAPDSVSWPDASWPGATELDNFCPFVDSQAAQAAPWEARPSRPKTCRCSCGAPCQTNADCGLGGICSVGVTCC